MRYELRGVLCLLLLSLSLTLSAQRHVRGIHPRHEKVHEMDSALLDITPAKVSADAAWQGINLPQAFTGSGVLVAVTDIGFDFTHPSFDGSHIVRFWDMLSRDTLNSLTPVFTGRDYEGAQLDTLRHSFDGTSNMHGTHVLGITSSRDQTYRGMAPDADILVVGNVLSNNYGLVDSLQKHKLEERDYKFDEFEYIFNYAEQQGVPCVINMSAGRRQSFGDDFDVYNARASQLTGPGRIIVAAAGNNGQQQTMLHKPVEKESVGSRIYINGSEVCYLFFQHEGDVQCNVLGSKDRGATKETLPQSLYERIDTLSDYDGKPVEYIILQQKRIEAEGYKSFYVTLTGTGEGRLFTQGTQYADGGEGFSDATCDYGVNFPAAYDDVICVGNTQFRNQVQNYEGKTIDWIPTVEEGRLCVYSSTGPRIDGVIKPDICAPGAYVISGVSSWEEELNPDSEIGDDILRFEHEGRTYAWRACSGTSMSAPVVAGIIALWLQANPRLTPQDIKEIFQRTARHPDPSLTYPNPIYGYGTIDAYAGLLDILGLSAVEGISHEQPRDVVFAVHQGRLIMHFAHEASAAELSVYSTSGQCIHRIHLGSVSGTQSVELPALPSGIYAVQLNSSQQHGSTLIRIQ